MPEKTVTSTAIRHMYAPTSRDKTHICPGMCQCFRPSAAPMVLLEGKHLQNSLPVGEEPGTMYAMGSGWMDSELFQMWFFNHFLKLVPKRRPLILFLDGHSLHFNIDMIKMAAKRASSYSVAPPPPLQHPCLSTTGQNMLFTTHAILVTAMHTIPEECLQKTHKVLFFSACPQSMVPSHDTMKCCCRVQDHTDFPFNRDAITLPPKSA